MYKSPRKNVKVIVWKSLNHKDIYIIDSSEKHQQDHENNIIRNDIYDDDSMDIALSKIGIYITNGENFQIYAWNKNKPLQFSITSPKWKGYNINPFKSTDQNSEELKDPVNYEYENKSLFKEKIINIAFSKDVPKQIHKYYFNTSNKLTIKQNNKREELLKSIVNTQDENVEILPEYYTRINYHSPLQNIFVAEVFDKIHTSKYIDMIQWVEDNSKILYKLSKHNRINKELFSTITNIDKINQNHVINIYSMYNKKSYCKISITNNDLFLNYILDARQYNKWKDIEKHFQKITQILQNMLKQKLNLQEIAVNCGVKMNINNSSFKLLTEKISKQIDIFNVVKKNNKNIVCTYKRSSNFSQNIEIYEYIRSRLNLGITNIEIADELVNLGISGNTLQMVNDEIDIIHKGLELKDRDSIKIKENGTIVVISPRFYGYDISIINSYNIQEMRYLLFWLSKILSQTIDKKINNKQKEIQKEKSKSNSKDSSVSIASSISSFESMGGNNKKDNYLITMLQQTDKELFGEYYARNKCQSHVQPIVFSKDHKELLERENKMIFDNVIEYGSSTNNLNYYACPKLWCPQSKVPLSVKGDQKCPLEDEEPIKMYKDIDKNKASYVKLIKPNDKGMCVPCCGKNPTTQIKINNCMSFLNKNQKLENNMKNKQDDENYLINHVAPIETGRYGTLPEFLHNLLSSEDHKNCLGSLNTKSECFIRKGVNKSSNNSIIYALMTIFQLKNINDLGKKINLDISTFISLDNGNICKAFMKSDDNDRYVKQMKKKQIEVNQINNKIYSSMMRYIDYIVSTNMTVNKDPQYILPLIYHLFQVNVIVWEKTNDISMLCNNPTFSKTKLDTKFALIIKEGNYYEPILLKKRSSSEKFIFKLDNYPKLKDLIKKCDYTETNNEIFNNLYELNNWIDNNISGNNDKYKISRILINDDLSIDKVLTRGNILLKFEKIGSSFIDKIVSDINVKEFLFVSNIKDIEYKINVSKKDLEKFVTKCKNLKITVNVGNVYKNDENMIQLYSKLKIKDIPDDLSNKMIIHNDELIEYHKNIEEIKNQTKKWYELQKFVAKRVIKNNSKSSVIFNNHPDKEIIQIILEEMPEDIEDIKKWLSNTIIQTKYDYLSSAIQDKSEFIFSQNALVHNGKKILPKTLLKYHRSLPNITEEEQSIETHNVNKMIKDEEISRPKIFEGSLKKLNTKWSKNKKVYWSNMVYIDTKYNKKTIEEFVEWLSLYIGNNQLNFSTVQETSRSIYMNMLNDKNAMYEIFHDSSYYNEWIKRSKKYSTINLYMEKYFNKLDIKTKQNIVKDILEKGDLWSTDIDIYSISQLLNISILILQRAVYGEFDEQHNRGDINDLKLSSIFFKSSNINERPLIIFNKVCDKNHCSYYLVVDKMYPNNLYISYDEIPDDIKKLMKLHMDN